MERRAGRYRRQLILLAKECKFLHAALRVWLPQVTKLNPLVGFGGPSMLISRICSSRRYTNDGADNARLVAWAVQLAKNDQNKTALLLWFIKNNKKYKVICDMSQFASK